MLSMIMFLNAQSFVSIEIYRQVYGHTRLDGQHIIQKFGWEMFNHPPYTWTSTSRNSCPVSVSVFRMRWVLHSGFNSRQQTSTTQDTKVGPTIWQMSQFCRWILYIEVHRCGQGGSMRACHAAGPGSFPSREKFPGWSFSGFFLTCKTCREALGPQGPRI